MARGLNVLPMLFLSALLLLQHLPVDAESRVEDIEEGEVASPVDIAISCMLCGSIFFIMMLFYLVNYPDDDIRYYAWSVISTTISIFTAVLMFKGIEGMIERLYFDHLSETHNVMATYSFFIVWLVVLETVITLLSGTYGLPCALEGQKVMLLKSWRTLLSHMVAFASLGAGGSLQQLSFVSSRPPLVFAAVAAHLGLLLVLLLICSNLRSCISKHRQDHAVDVWLEQATEAENDIVAMSASFLLVQALRLAISGILPDPEGLEEPQHEHPFRCTASLLIAAACFGVLVILFVCAGSGGRLDNAPKLKRSLAICKCMSAMVLAWSFFFAGKWELKRLAPAIHPNSMIAAVLLALVYSVASFAAIFAFDWLEDLESTGHEVDRALVSLISALGILVGFGWEQSFEGAATRLASLTTHPIAVKLFLAFVVALIVIPAWQKYILTTAARVEAIYLSCPTKTRSKKFDQDLAQELAVTIEPAELVQQIARSVSQEFRRTFQPLPQEDSMGESMTWV